MTPRLKALVIAVSEGLLQDLVIRLCRPPQSSCYRGIGGIQSYRFITNGVWPPQSSCYRGIGGGHNTQTFSGHFAASKLLLSRYRRGFNSLISIRSPVPPQSSCYRGIGGFRWCFEGNSYHAASKLLLSRYRRD